MDLIDQLNAIAKRVPNIRTTLQTEEATKNALIMPFIMALGYNVFDPSEVTPEIIADVGVKKGEKVDYAILRDNKPIILFECKKCGADLGSAHASQLFRYFTVTDARFAILTNGIHYRFYTDLDQPNKMDERPFLEFDLLDFKEQDIDEVGKFSKTKFNIPDILATASELKYTRAIQKILTEQLANPTEEFVKVLTAPVYSGRMTPPVRAQFAQLTKRAFQQFISDRINERLKVALEGTGPLERPEAGPGSEEAPIVVGGKENATTTDEEREAFLIVRAIVCELVAAKRVVMRDAQSYCAILLDDNNRRTICRLCFNSPKKKYIQIPDGNKEMARVDISDVQEIYQQASRLKEVVKGHLVGTI